jgi:hypothetical protein
MCGFIQRRLSDVLVGGGRDIDCIQVKWLAWVRLLFTHWLLRNLENWCVHTMIKWVGGCRVNGWVDVLVGWLAKEVMGILYALSQMHGIHI